MRVLLRARCRACVETKRYTHTFASYAYIFQPRNNARRIIIEINIRHAHLSRYSIQPLSSREMYILIETVPLSAKGQICKIKVSVNERSTSNSRACTRKRASYPRLPSIIDENATGRLITSLWRSGHFKRGSRVGTTHLTELADYIYLNFGVWDVPL